MKFVCGLILLSLVSCSSAQVNFEHTALGKKINEKPFEDDCSDPECISRVVTYENGIEYYRFDGTIAAVQSGVGKIEETE